MIAFLSTPADTPTLSPFPIPPLACSLFGNGIGAEGATALAAILKETKITHLKCTATPEVFAFVSATPLTTHLRPRACSLFDNDLGPQGGAALAESLKGNSTLRWLEYAACGSNRLLSVRLSVSAH